MRKIIISEKMKDGKVKKTSFVLTPFLRKRYAKYTNRNFHTGFIPKNFNEALESFCFGLKGQGVPESQIPSIIRDNEKFLKRKYLRWKGACRFDYSSLGTKIGKGIVRDINKGRKMPKVVSDSRNK